MVGPTLKLWDIRRWCVLLDFLSSSVDDGEGLEVRAGATPWSAYLNCSPICAARIRVAENLEFEEYDFSVPQRDDVAV